VPAVVAVVLNWNNLPDTLECVSSLSRSDWPNLFVWVVDNGSREDPTGAVAAYHPGVRVIRNARNQGYGAGNNIALKHALEEDLDYALILNNDVTVAPDTVRCLVEEAEADRRIAMATPTVFYYDRPTEVYWDGGIIDWETGDPHHRSTTLPLEGEIRRSEWLDGCAMLVRLSALRKIGFLDERYFLYFEDTDWSLRARSLGWLNAVVVRAKAWHKVSRSTGGWTNPAVHYYYARNRYRFIKTHCPARVRRLWRLQYAYGYARRLLAEYRLLPPGSEIRQAIAAAGISLVRGRWGPYEPSTAGRRLVAVLDSIERLLRGLKRCRRSITRLARTIAQQR
jgi:GT2 family glycosyltransferase